MQNLVLTQLSTPELQQIICDAVKTALAEQSLKQTTETDIIGGVELAMEITGKAKPTIYDLVHKRLIPHSKRGKQLYFSRRELLEWINSGKRKTVSEIQLDAQILRR